MENKNKILFFEEDFDNESEHEKEKMDKKQKLVRGEFAMIGKYDMPLVRKQDIDLNAIDLMGFTKAKISDAGNVQKTLHFFTYDWLFDAVYSKPEKALEKLGQYYALLTPDFSTYKDMPIARQIDSVFKNRWCGAFWQKQGAKVIPAISWGDVRTFDFCFDGVEQGSIVAVSTYSRADEKELFMKGYNRMIEVIRPSAIICYGEPFDEMRGNIKWTDPFDSKRLIEKIGMKEYMEKLLNGTLYPEV